MSTGARGWTLVVLQAVLLVGLLLLPRRQASTPLLIIGIVLVAAGVVLLLASFRRLGNALTPTPVPIAGAGLRTTGAYAWVRHPIYSALLLIVLGYLVAWGGPWGWTWGAITLLFFWGKSRWEDRLLEAEYGAEWTAWSTTTGALIPRIRGARRQA